MSAFSAQSFPIRKDCPEEESEGDVRERHRVRGEWGFRGIYSGGCEELDAENGSRRKYLEIREGRNRREERK